jgi:hypothetical protein
LQRTVKSISATAKTLNHKSVGVDEATTHIGAKIRTISRTAKLFGRKFLVFFVWSFARFLLSLQAEWKQE